MFTTDLTLAREHVEAGAIRADIEDYQVLADYSGRGMYGRQCLGVVANTKAEAFAILAGAVIEWTAASLALGEPLDDVLDGADELLRALIARACVDNMGLDVIVYAPDVTLIDDDPDATS